MQQSLVNVVEKGSKNEIVSLLIKCIFLTLCDEDQMLENIFILIT